MSRYTLERGPDARHTHRLPAENDKSRRVAKVYALNGVPGLVERRKARQTGTFVEIYRVDQSVFDRVGLDARGEPWGLVCVHRNVVGCSTLSLAKDMAADPKIWCELCGGAP